MEQREERAEARLRVITEHMAGRITATAGAQALGVSRKTFYEWLERAKSAMRQALVDRPGGRPPHPVDPEKEQLRAELRELEQEQLVLESRLRIQEAIRQTVAEMQAGLPPKKKGAG